MAETLDAIVSPDLDGAAMVALPNENALRMQLLSTMLLKKDSYLKKKWQVTSGE